MTLFADAYRGRDACRRCGRRWHITARVCSLGFRSRAAAVASVSRARRWHNALPRVRSPERGIVRSVEGVTRLGRRRDARGWRAPTRVYKRAGPRTNATERLPASSASRRPCCEPVTYRRSHQSGRSKLAIRSDGGWSGAAMSGAGAFDRAACNGRGERAAPSQGRCRLAGSSSDFSATKVVPPRCEGLIARPRLLGHDLPACRQATGCSQGAGRLRQDILGCGLVAATPTERQRGSLADHDPDDDEPAAFLFYVSHSLQRACEGVGAGVIDLIRESFLINPRAIVTKLINDLADIDDEVYLFLEDYHWVTSPEIYGILTFFLRHAPSHCHVVLTTRAEPPLPLASLRAQNQLLEIDASALRFDLQETQNFLEFEAPDTLVPSEVKLLHEKTEGWAAALRIVASTPIQSRQDFAQYVLHLSGTQRSIGTYLDEMFAGLPREMVEFMLRTAILDRLCTPLCESLTGASSSGALLRSIEERQLLLTPLDQERKWYRYHPLLSEYSPRGWHRSLGMKFRAASTRFSLVCVSGIVDRRRPTCDRGRRRDSSAGMD